MKTKILTFLGCLFFLQSVHFDLNAQAGPKGESILWQREYNAIVNGEKLIGAYIGSKHDATPAFADIDSDGDQDLFIGEYDGNISFLRNDGTPNGHSWTLVTDKYGMIDVGIWSTPAFTDIDGDGDLDLFIGENYGGISFYRNDGTPTEPSWTMVTGNYNSIYVGYTSAPAFADIDGDGDQDLFIGEENGNINFYRNDGTRNEPSWTNVSSYYNSIDVGSYSTPAFADIDNDGDLDLFIGEVSGNINFYRNDGTPTEPSWTLVTESYNSIDLGMYSRCAPTFTDIDSDGDKDLFVGEEKWNINFYRNDGTLNEPSWTFISENYNSIKVDEKSSPAFADIDGDGDLDLFIGERYNGHITFYRNDGTPNEPAWTLVSEDYNSIDKGYWNAPTFTDIDGDEDLDLFIGEGGGSIIFYRNDGTSHEPLFVLVSEHYNSINVWDSNKPAFADIDGDGDKDLFVGEYNGNLNFYSNDGTNEIPLWRLVTENYNSIDVGNASAPAFADIEGDGDFDLFIGDGDGNITFYRNDGTPNEPSWTLISESYNLIDVGSESTPAFADIDNDGDPDLFIGEYSGGINFWRKLSYQVDLLTDHIETSPICTIGDSILISGSVKNQGSDTSLNFVVNYYLSPDTLINTDDIFLGSRDINALPPSASFAESIKFPVSSGIKHGWYYLGVISDANENVPEYNEINNREYFSTPVYVSTTSGYNVPPNLYGGTVIPDKGHPETEYIFRVNYIDADDDTPLFVFVNIDDTILQSMAKSEGDGNFTNGELYELRTKLSQGNHIYSFLANEEYFEALGDIYTHTGPIVSSTATSPVLSNGTVFPETGTPSTNFRFSVIYSDADNDTCSEIFLKIDDNATFSVTPVDNSDDIYSDGKTYEYYTKLNEGEHTFKFSARDWSDMASGDTSAHVGPDVVLSGSAPELTNGSVTPQEGFQDSVFTYCVVYTDKDGLPPSVIIVKIDDYSYPMTMITKDPPDYMAGETFKYETILETGSHTYSFIAVSGGHAAKGDITTHYGPEVLDNSGSFSPLAGKWTGTTSQGKPVSFTVSDDGSTILNFIGSVLTSPSYLISISAAEKIISNNSFTILRTGINFGNFEGTFSSPTICSGSMYGVHQTLFEGWWTGEGTWTAAPLSSIKINTPQNEILVNIPIIEVSGFAAGPLVSSAKVNDIPVALVDGSFSTNVELNEGENTISLVAFNNSDQIVGTYSIIVTLDSSPPVVSITEPLNNLETTQQVVYVAGTVNDPSILYLNINSMQVCVAEGLFNTTVPLLPGNNSISAACYDEAGNPGGDTISVKLLCLNNGRYLYETICEGESYQIGDSIYNESGIYVTALQNQNGCDSIVTLNLTVYLPVETSQSATICQGKSLIFGTQTLITAGSYTEVFPSVHGCDSTVTLTLNVNPTFNEVATATICQGNSYTFGSQILTTAGSYTEVFQSVSGCDSTITLTLNVNPTFNEVATATICQGNSYTFGSQTLTTAGSYTEVFQSISGCDSTVTLTLNVNPTFNEVASATICQGSSYTFGKQTLTAAGSYTEVFPSILGCDSTVTLTLNVNLTFNEVASATICQGNSYTFGTQTLTTQGSYTEVFQSVQGCDSTVTLTLDVNPTFNEVASATICQGNSYTFGTQTLTTQGSYSEVFHSILGCDSTVTLTLNVNPIFNEVASATICQGNSYTFGTQALTTPGSYSEVFPSILGCDSTVTLTLNVNPTFNEVASATICQGNSYTFGTQTLTTSGSYTEVFHSVPGCDSTVVLSLAVNSVDVSVSQTQNVLTANNQNGTYQWIDCNGHVPIAGESNRTFTAKARGSFAVIITENMCTDTSDCFSVTDVSINELSADFFNVHPNPTTGELTVEVTEPMVISISNITGRRLQTIKLNKKINIIDLSRFPDGIYFLNTTGTKNGRGVKVLKLSQ